MKSKNSTKGKAAKTEEFEAIPVGQLMQLDPSTILPDPKQPRKHFDEASLQELADSLKKVGMMQPVAVHPNDAGGFDLIAGERRLRASHIAEMKSIPAMVYPRLSENLVRELQITENLHRKDVNPMEESDAFHDLTKRGLTSADDIARRISKSTKYVYDRLALQNVIEPVKDMLRSGDIPITQGKLFAQLNLDDQQELYEVLCKHPDSVSASDIRKEIADRFSRVLANAPFDIENDNLNPGAGACTNCPKRSGCNGLLFDDVSSKDICFDKACYDKKVAASMMITAKELEAAGNVVFYVSGKYGYGQIRPALLDQFDRVLVRHDYQVIDEDETSQDHESWKTYGVVVDPNYGGEPAIGTVMKIEITDEDICREFGWIEDEQEDEDQDEEDAFDDGEDDQPAKRPKADYINHSENFTKHLVDKVLAKFKENMHMLLDANSSSCRAKRIIKSVDEDTAQYAFEKMGWELVEDENGDLDLGATIAKAHDEMKFGAGYLVDFAEVLMAIDMPYWDRSDLVKLSKEYPDLTIDIAAEMDAYEKAHDHKFPE